MLAQELHRCCFGGHSETSDLKICLLESVVEVVQSFPLHEHLR